MTIPLTILHYLRSEDIVLLETKRLDKPRETDKSKVYHWWLYTPQTGIQKLDFVSMKSTGENEERIFKQGKLTFSIAASGLYEDKSGRYLLQHTVAPPDDNIVNAVVAFLEKSTGNL
jgi:hypothetical protein